MEEFTSEKCISGETYIYFTIHKISGVSMTEVTLICPICGRARTEPSFEEFLEKVRKAWEHWRPLPAYLESSLQKTNDPKRLKVLLEERGYLFCFCQDCAMAATVASARNTLEVG